MSVFKANFFFRQFQQGWTETWFHVDPDLTTAVGSFHSLSPALARPRSVQTLLQAFRVVQADPGLPRVTRLFGENLAGSRLSGGTGEFEDVVPTAARYRIQFSDGVDRPHLWRGLEDTDVARDPTTGAGTPSTGLNSAINALITKLRTLGMAARVFDKTIAETAVISVGPTLPPGGTLVTTNVAHGLAAFQPIRFHGVPLGKLPWLRGTWLPQSVTATTLTLGYPFNLAAPVVPSNMFVIANIYLYPTVNIASFQDFSSRKTGRPIGLTRGRSRGIPFRRLTHAAG